MAAADARRRAREADRRLWRAAPVIAVVCLIGAVASRWGGFGSGAPLILTALGVAGLAVDTYMRRRRHAVSDAVAARVDADAGFGGELRSATWFAAREKRDEWAEYHVGRAAARVSVVDWSQLYPPVRARRAQVATAAAAIAAVAVAVTLPGRASVRAQRPSAAAAGTGQLAGKPALRLELLPEELRKQLEDLIAAAERGQLSAEQQKQAIDFWNLFAEINADLDEEMLKELAEAMDPLQLGSPDEAARKLLDLAGRAQKAADARAASPETRRALENLGAQLAEAAQAEQQLAASGPETGQGKPAHAAASADSADGPPKLDQASIQFAKDSEPGAGAGMMMLSQQLGPKGQPSSGFGGAGNTGTPPNGGVAPELAQALRRETIEASEDTTGDNVLSEARRKTEYGRAAVPFTRSAAGPAGRSRASAPPLVPEGRRAAVQSYFTRKQ